MSEYTIVGVKPVLKVLKLVSPYLRIKTKQAEVTLKVLRQMPGSGRKMTPALLLELSLEVDKFIDLNYSKRRTNTSSKVVAFLKEHQLF